MNTPKTRLEWFNLLPEPYKTQAIENYEEKYCGKNEHSLFNTAADAIMWGFEWDFTPQGDNYWREFTNNIALKGIPRSENNELHVCQHCGAQTTQSDDECYAKLLPESPTPSIDYEKVVKETVEWLESEINKLKNDHDDYGSGLRGGLEETLKFIQSKTKEQ